MTRSYVPIFNALYMEYFADVPKGMKQLEVEVLGEKKLSWFLKVGKDVDLSLLIHDKDLVEKYPDIIPERVDPTSLKLTSLLMVMTGQGPKTHMIIPMPTIVPLVKTEAAEGAEVYGLNVSAPLCAEDPAKPDAYYQVSIVYNAADGFCRSLAQVKNVEGSMITGQIRILGYILDGVITNEPEST